MVDAITMNNVRVRQRPRQRNRGRCRFVLYIATALAAVTAAAAPLGYDYYSGQLGIVWAEPEVIETPQGRVIKVPPGGNLQGALETAQGGDIIELQAGAVYAGQINLPNKPHRDFVTIRSSAAASLPEGVRVKPSQRSAMATITSGAIGRAAVMAKNGAHHYRFVGIEFTSAGTAYNYGLIVLGDNEKRPQDVPHSIEIDRSYIHPHKSGRSRRGVALNSADTVIKNSYIEGFAVTGEEGQGVCGWTGTRNVKILNNYIEGGAQNIMFGGADPPNAEMIPSDIEVRGNHLRKPESWKKGVTVKTIYELKNAKRSVFSGNLMENNWIGSAFRITVRNQDGGAPFSTIEDAEISDNILIGSGDGINILGSDDTYPSQTLKRLTIRNNLFLDINGNDGFEGGGYFIQVSSGENITIANNTVLNRGNITTLYGTMPRAFVFRDNITGHGEYGIHGPIDRRSAEARSMFTNNVFINLNRVAASDLAFPEGNTLIGSLNEAGFVNAASRDFRLGPGSRFAGKGASVTLGENVRSE